FPGKLASSRASVMPQTLTFSQIIANQDSGIIPRITDDHLYFLFWKKLSQGGFVGCVIDRKELMSSLLKSLPPLESNFRFLNILDEKGHSLFPSRMGKDKRLPFVSIEVFEGIPSWRVVAYLENPALIAGRANTIASMTWLLIFMLLITVIIGVFVILQSIRSEMLLAQQKEIFATNVSHELRTPLTSIRLLVEMLRENRIVDEAKRRQYLEIIDSEAQRLSSLVERTLQFTKMRQKKYRYQKRVIDLVVLCENFVENQRLGLRKEGFQVWLEKKISTASANVDEEAMRQVLENLFSNARKYSQNHQEIVLRIFAKDKNLRIEVEDHGIGVQDQDIHKIFDPFYRAEQSLSPKVPGTGLGLTIARQIVRDHGGELKYIKKLGGSIFQIQLPQILK
ncbi:MAG: HAMP domain-containing histidine kinase, partial [Candidatus Omnitrophica bacterium]|nr:HAMP domain-containing histidine kinase [Candidatus Omnitrophota bacterium]